ncbi:MAG TPA: hypothetical protein VFR47_25615 [Anaerolineales bacterium]|nr:hypothetical protein [Anaerolineales bacterium]
MAEKLQIMGKLAASRLLVLHSSLRIIVEMTLIIRKGGDVIHQ